MVNLSQKARALLSVQPGNSGGEPGFELGQELETLRTHRVEWSDEHDIKPLDGKWGKFKVRTRVHNYGSRTNLKNTVEEDELRSDLECELTQKEINLVKLQKIASNGLLDGGDGGSLRATTWKLLLGYLPTSKDLWHNMLSENRLMYLKLKKEYLLNPSQLSSKAETSSSGEHCDGQLRRHDVSGEDHPLSFGAASVWHKFFEYTEVAEQIDRDLQRTHPDLEFFSSNSLLNMRVKESMKNILLLFAKLNPTTHYVQGMNEILAPIFYVFSIDPDEENSANAEADSFACFVRLLSDSVDHFCQQLDNNSSVGIHFTLSRLTEMIKVNDLELWQHLQFTSKVNPQFYAFRWITLLLTQEFPFNTVLRIWDSLLSDPSGVQDMLLRVCCAMLMSVRSKLLTGDFAANLYLLQHYPEVDIEHLLQVAQDIVPGTSMLRVSLE